MKNICKFLMIFLMLFMLTSIAFAQEYPSKPIHLYVNFAPGGATDQVARIIGDEFSKRLGVDVIVENKPGGRGTLGPTLIANAKPDGYIIGTTTASVFITSPYMMDIMYDPFEDFEFIGQIDVTHHPVAVKADSPWDTLEDLIEYARENPGKLTYATAGVWNSQHIAMYQLFRQAGVEAKYVPFVGGSEPIMQLLGGHIDVVAVSDFAAQAQAGGIRLLAETGPVNILGFEDVPTFLELGYDFYSLGLAGLIAPKGTPREIVSKLADTLEQIVQDPQVISILKGINVTPSFLGPTKFENMLRKVHENYGKALKAAGVIN